MHSLPDIENLIPGIKRLFSHTIGEPILFSSGLFWILFILFISIYAFIYSRKVQMMLYVTAFSLFFYYQTNGLVFVFLPATALLDFTLAKILHASTNKLHRKILLTYSIVMSVGILACFKYTNFFITTWNDIFSDNFQLYNLILPVGISFYTFQSISYITDVYKGKIKPANSFLQYLFYLSFFPLILAGPIMRAEKFFPQIQSNKRISSTMIYGGLWLVMIGIIKKAVFADYIAQYNNWIFEAPLHFSGFENLMGVLGYGAQIYCDFSGYSDMSIGIASIMGFDLGKNFNLPYQSSNITEFWRRWHISLSSWMRDYIYIPLGGNRTTKFRTYLNYMITMLIAGLWHGASWMFIIWGGLHGLGLVIHKINKPWLDKIPNNFPARFLSWLITFSFVSFLWIFFRSVSMENSIELITRIGSDFSLSYALPFLKARTTWCIFIILIFAFHAVPGKYYDKFKYYFINSPWILKVILFLIVVQLVIQFQTGSVQPFIYFQF